MDEVVGDGADSIAVPADPIAVASRIERSGEEYLSWSVRGSRILFGVGDFLSSGRGMWRRTGTSKIERRIKVERNEKNIRVCHALFGEAWCGKEVPSKISAYRLHTIRRRI